MAAIHYFLCLCWLIFAVFTHITLATKCSVKMSGKTHGKLMVKTTKMDCDFVMKEIKKSSFWICGPIIKSSNSIICSCSHGVCHPLPPSVGAS